MVADGRADWHAGPITPTLFDKAAMAFIGTGCPGIDTSLYALARADRCPVNVVDQPELCDMTTPALVDRDPVVVAIGSEGTAPVLTSEIQTQLERMLPGNLGGLAALAGRLRADVSARMLRQMRRAFWAWVFKGAPRDPLTRRAAEHLQEADVILHDRLVDPGVLDLARRDAERVHVGKTVGAHDCPQDSITAAIIAEARNGRRVVRLKSGDPGIFGRATEELEAARGRPVRRDRAGCHRGLRGGRALRPVPDRTRRGGHARA